MAYFAWSNSLSIGNSILDEDHRRLIKLVDDLHSAMDQGKGREVLGGVLAELLKYTREHFKREEDFMQRIGYEDFLAHKQEHERLVLSLRDIQKRFDTGEAVLTLTVSSFLFEWLFNHIMRVDKKLAAVALDKK